MTIDLLGPRRSNGSATCGGYAHRSGFSGVRTLGVGEWGRPPGLRRQNGQIAALLAAGAFAGWHPGRCALPMIWGAGPAPGPHPLLAGGLDRASMAPTPRP